jgi:hypothetical protein
MCPDDRKKLEEVVTKAFADLAEVAAVESTPGKHDLH